MALAQARIIGPEAWLRRPLRLQTDARPSANICRDEEDACLFQRYLEPVERISLHAAFVGFEAMDRGVRDLGALSEHPDVDPQSGPRHTDLSRTDHS